MGWEMIEEVLYRLIRLAVRMMSHIRYPLAQHFGKGLGTIAYLIPMSRKEVALENIKRSFPALTERETKRLLKKVYLHFGQMFFEIPHIYRMTQDTLDRYMIFDGEEHVVNALSRKKGVFFLSAHFGNWEFLCAAGALRAGSLAVIARPADFKSLDRAIGEIRSLFGTEVIPKQKALRRVRTALRENKLIGILLDQNVDWYEGGYVPFFDQWACTNKALALISLIAGTPVVPAFPVRQKDGRYRIIFEKAVELQRTGDRTKDIEINTEMFTNIIEKYIRKHPDHWFWFHKRWKTKNYCPLPY